VGGDRLAAHSSSTQPQYSADQLVSRGLISNNRLESTRGSSHALGRSDGETGGGEYSSLAESL